MSAYKIIGDSAEREEWLDLRRTLVCASDVASVLGVPGAWGSGLSVAVEKLGVGEIKSMSEPQEAGLRLEKPIAEWAAEEIGGECEMHGFLLRSIKHPWLGCTPDAMICVDGETVPLQVKNTIFASDWRNEPPPAVLVQVLTELIVTGAPFGYVCTLLMGNRLRWAKVVPAEHEPECEMILEETATFWWKLKHGERIEPDASEASRKAIERLWPAKEGKTIALEGRFVGLDNARQDCLIQAKANQDKADEISNQIREAMGEAEHATLTNGVAYSYVQGKRSRPLLRKPAKENQ